MTRTGRHETSDHGPHTMRITTPAGTAYESTAPPLLGWGSQDPPADGHPPRLMLATENRRLEHLQTRVNNGDDLNDADWTEYDVLTPLAAG